MTRLTSAFLGTVLTFSTVTRAWDDVQVPDTVQADNPTTVSVNLDSDAAGYVVYLATTPPGWGTGPACLLADYTDMSVTSLDVKIPASVVPDGTFLSLAYSVFESREDYDSSGGSGYGYSNDFNFEGGTGEWSALELSGYDAIPSVDQTPCSALGCTRDCGGKFYPDGQLNDGSEDTYKNYYNCVAACPGTTYPSYEDAMGDDDGDNATASASATASYDDATASGTAPVTASATASTTPGSLTPHTTLSSAKATGSSLSSSPSETAPTRSASAAASSTSVVTSGSAGRTSLTSTALLVWCIGLLLRI